MPAQPPLLALEGVTKRFGAVQALAGVDFEVYAGEVVALVGDNGAGKSTLVKIISGIYTADEGRFSADGAPVVVRGPADAPQLGIATVYQDLALADNLDVVANLFLGSEELSHGPGRATLAARRDGHGAALALAARPARGHDPERPLRGRHAVGRSAPAGRGGALAAGRAADHAPGRADRRARRRPDRPGARAHQAAARARPRRGRHQPQPRRRVRGRGPDRRAAPRAPGRIAS